jgi:hypothetical protein
VGRRRHGRGEERRHERRAAEGGRTVRSGVERRSLGACANLAIGQIASPHNENYDTYRRLKDQLEARRAAEASASDGASRSRSSSLSPTGGEGAAAKPSRKPGKLSFKEQRELEGMEAAILAAEERKSALEAALGDPATYQKDGAAVAGMRTDLEVATAEVERLYARWQELEAVRAGSPS